MSGSNSNRYCSVPQCGAWEKKNSDVHFHAFPTPGREYRVWVEDNLGNKVLMDRHNAWKLKLKITRPITKNMKICSLHFTDQDYFYRDPNSKQRKFLKRNALPSKNLPNESFTKKRAIHSGEKTKKTRRKNGKRNIVEDENSTPEKQKPTSQDSQEEIWVAESLLELLHSQQDEGL